MSPFEDHVKGLSVCGRHTYGVCVTGQDALFDFLTHPLLHLFAQILRVVLRHDEMNVVD